MKILIYRFYNDNDSYIGTTGQSLSKIVGLIKEFSKRKDINWAPARYLRENGIDSLRYEIVRESNRRDVDHDLYEIHEKYKPNLNINIRF